MIIVLFFFRGQSSKIEETNKKEEE
jgi:hypothetical protein